MAERVRGNAYRSTRVCIDDGQTFSGRLSNPYRKEEIPFCGVMEFLRQMELLLDEMKLPQAFAARRAFGSPGVTDRMPPEQTPRRGGAATFDLRILFRQNASWQGSVTWIEAQQEEPFRSVLELLLLMDSALRSRDHDALADGRSTIVSL
jgi:hypothetical protein